MPFTPDLSPWDDAVAKISAKTPIGTALRSDQLDGVGLALREAAMFSARVESVKLLSAMQRGVLDALQGNRTPGGALMDRGRFISDMRKLAEELGIGQLGKSEITNMQGPARLGLIYDMLTRQATGYARWKTGQDPDMLNAWPAQRLIRVATRREPRDWEERWARAASEVAFEGVARTGMAALKDSPVWKALSRFGTPWPPFDYGSGMGVEDIGRDEAEALGLVRPGEVVGPRGEEDFAASLEASVKDVPEDMRALLKKVGVNVAGDKAVPMKKAVKAVMQDPETKPAKTFNSQQRAEQWGQDRYKGWSTSASPIERNAIHTFQQSPTAFKKINAMARGDGVWYEDDDDQPKPLDGLDRSMFGEMAGYIRDALAKASTPEDVHVYRGTDSLHELGMSLEDIDDGVIGLEFPVKGFKSTSLVPDNVGDFVGFKNPLVLEVDVPKGARAAYINALGASGGMAEERELLISDQGTMVATGRGTRYVEGIGEVVVIFMKLIP